MVPKRAVFYNQKVRSQPFTYEQFKAIYSQVPRLTVEVIVQVNSGVVLALRQEHAWEGLWHIPGGTVYYGEPLTQAVTRVAQEELALQVTIDKQVGYIEYPSEAKLRGFGWSVGIAFLCQPAGDIPYEKWRSNHIDIFTALPKNIVSEQLPLLTKFVAESAHL